MEGPLNINPPMRMQKAAVAALTLLAVFLLAKTITEVKIWGSLNDSVTNTITVAGSGDVFAVPDIAAFSFTIFEEAKTVTEAQKQATEKNNAAIKYLKSMGVEDRDIKTESYSANPKYEYQEVVCVRYPCPSGKQSLVGYEVSQSVSVKVRKTDIAGEVLAGIGKLNVSNISGLSFTIDNEDTLKAEARAKAIEVAKAKAEVLAKDLGSRLGSVVSFSEDGGGYPGPMYAMKSEGMDGIGGGGRAPVPDIAKGENKITVNVSITYRIK